MKKALFLFFIALYIYITFKWLNLDGEISMGPYLSLFMSTMNRLDHFLFSAVVTYLGGIMMFVCYAMVSYLMKFDKVSFRPVLLWSMVYPLFIILGVLLVKIGIWDDRSDCMYLIIGSIVAVFVIDKFLVSESLQFRHNKVLYTIILSLYLLSFVALSQPRNKWRWMFPNHKERVFEIPSQKTIVRVATHSDTVRVCIGKESQDFHHLLQFYYIDKDAVFNDTFNRQIFVYLYGNKVFFFRSDNIIVTHYGDYESTTRDEVLHEGTFFEYLISSKNISVIQSANGQRKKVDVIGTDL